MKQTSNITQRLAQAQEDSAKTKLGQNDTLFRIYTEDVYPDTLDDIVNRYFDGFTVFSGTGYYKGEREYSAVIEIIAKATDLQTVVNLAGDIRHIFKQYSVLVTSQPITLVNVR